MGVELKEITSQNWRRVAAVRAASDQTDFVAEPTYYMCLAHYEDVWTSLAIEAEGDIVGHLMWGYDEAEDAFWLGGLIIDAASQRQGWGRAAVEAFIERFAPNPDGHVALSYDPNNEIARNLYRSLGFVETGEAEDEEIVARLRRS